MSKPRTKFYACGTVYRQFAKDLAWNRIHKGNDVFQFESAAAEHFGCRHAIATPMARVAIYLCLRHYIQPGQQVITSPYTLAEVINMIVCAGGMPFFADVERENAHLDPSKLESIENLGAILVTHLHGIPAQMRTLLDFANEQKVPVIEDAAQSAGAKFGGRFVGTIGDAGVLSFGMLKQMNSLYGGMILTDDASLAEFVRDELKRYRMISTATLLDKLAYLLRLNSLTTNPIFSWGMFPVLRYGVLNDIDWINKMVAVEVDLRIKHQLDDWYRHRMSPSQARMLQKQLPHLKDQDRQRVRNAETYLSQLQGVDGLVLPKIDDEAQPTYAHFPIQVEDPAGLLRWFNFYGQDVVAQHLFNCAELPCFSEFHRVCPVASKVAKSLVLLPTYPGFDAVNIQRNIAVLKAYFRAGEPPFSRRAELSI